MLNNFKILKKELTNTRLYCLVVEGREYTSLSVQIARSLEEAFFLAKREFVNKNPHLEEKLIGAKIGLFEVKELPELFFGSSLGNLTSPSIGIKKIEKNKISPYQPVEIKKDENLEKNKFIKFLIDNQNTEILEKNKNLFTDNEIKYVQEKITAKKTVKENKKNDSI